MALYIDARCTNTGHITRGYESRAVSLSLRRGGCHRANVRVGMILLGFCELQEI